MSVAANSLAGALTDRLARVDVLIVNYNAGKWLARSVETVFPRHATEPNVIIVDNGSADDSLNTLESSISRTAQADRIKCDRVGHNTGFAAGVNRAAARASREFLLILNPDCLIDPPVLARLVDELDRHPETAMVSGKVLDPDGKEQRGSRRHLPTPARILNEMLRLGGEGIDTTWTPRPDHAVEVEAVSGACMLVRRSAFVALGGMDERYPLHFEDLDLFSRLIDAGWKLRWVPEAEIKHAGGQSSATRPVAVLWAKYLGLWRYLNRHCTESWPIWQRPFWLLALGVHAAARTPFAWWSKR